MASGTDSRRQLLSGAWSRDSAAAVVMGVSVLISVVGQATTELNHDVAWSLVVAELMSRGSVLYRDILEVNPPLVFWMSSVLDSISQATGIDIELLLRAVVTALISSTAWWAWRVTNHFATLCAILAGLLVVPLFHFGQRDLLAATLLLPYVLSTARGRPSMAAGVLAGIGLSLKPHYTPIWLLLAMVHRRRAVDVVIIAVGVLYVASVALGTEYVPMIRLLGPLYSRWIELGSDQLLLHPAVLLPLAMLFLALLSRMRCGSAPGLVVPYTLAALGAAAGFVLQGKAFGYHAVPALAFVLLAAGQLPWRSALPVVAAALLALVSVSQARPYDIAAMPAIMQEMRQPRTAFLTHHFQRAVPVARDGDGPWMLPVTYVWWVKIPRARATLPGLRLLDQRLGSALDSADVVLVEAAPRDSSPGAPSLSQMLPEPVVSRLVRDFESVPSGYLHRWERRLPSIDSQ